MDPRRDHGPFMNPGPFQGYHEHGGDPHMWGWLFFALVLAFLIGLAVFLVVRYAGRRAAAPVALDEPLALLRMRYARGEVRRDQFLQASVDLGASPAPPDEPPPS